MKELKLKLYFENKISPEELNLNLIGTAKAAGEMTIGYWIEDMDENFTVTPSNIIKLCKDVLRNKIDVEHLQSISFCILGSDQFHQSDGSKQDDVMTDVLIDWSTPKVDQPFNKKDVERSLKELERASNKPGTANDVQLPCHFLFITPPKDSNIVYFKALGEINELNKYSYIEFNSANSTQWIGAFERGLIGFDGIRQHPNKKHMIVVAGGEGYIIDHNSKQLVQNIGNSYSKYFNESSGLGA